jgi:DNA sulfur modification protein DndD
MIFTELVLQNFGPYYGKNIINLRTEMEEKSSPIILFGGMNGGGKTTIMDAIRLALYGARAQCSTRGNLSYPDFLNQCINNNISKELSPNNDHQTRIELSFEHLHYDRWKELKIVRYWTRNPKDGKDNLGILEGDWPDTALANTWDEYIESLLPVGISNLFLFDGEQVKELAEQEKPPQTVLEAIKALLGLELADKLAIDLDILANRKRKILASESQLIKLEEIELQLIKLNEEKTLIEQQESLVTKRLEQAENKQRTALNEFMLQGGKIAAEKSKLQTSIEHLKTDAEKQRELLRQLAANLAPLGLILPLLKQASIQGEKELKAQQAKISLGILEERDQRLLAFLSSIKAANFQQISQFLSEENEQLKKESDLEQNPWLHIKKNELQQLNNLIEIVLPTQIQSAKKILKNLADLEEIIESKERELAVAASPEAYNKLAQELEKAEQEVRKYNTELKVHQNQKENLDQKINKIKKELEKYSEKILDRQNTAHIISSIAKVKDTLAIFKQKLTLRKLNKLEIEVSECFRYLLHKSNLVHRVVINSNDFSLSIYDPNGHQLPKHRLSAGEKQLLAIAFLWGLARVSGRNLPVAIDTPLGRLDSSHRNNLIERYFPTASHQVILLSTDTEIGEKEVTKLRQQEAIAREYLLKYDTEKHQTAIESGYFW